MHGRGSLCLLAAGVSVDKAAGQVESHQTNFGVAIFLVHGHDVLMDFGTGFQL